jgi:hypothetical protein
MNEVSISPQYTVNTPLKTIEDKINVFEDQIRGWVLNHAQALASGDYNFQEHAGFAILMLVSSYFEAIEAFYRGRPSKAGESKKFFKVGFLRVFEEVPKLLKNGLAQLQDELLNELYEQLRCGLYHEAMTKGKIILRHDTAAMGFLFDPTNLSIPTIVIDPWQMLARVETHFTGFIAKVKDPHEKDLRAAFEMCFDLKVARRTPVIPPVTLSTTVAQRNASTP